MANEVTKFINNPTVMQRIEERLKNKSGQFVTSLLSAVNSNARLANCRPETVLNAAMTAASLDLPINPNLGFAALVPYNDECQFQMQWKGFVQLAQRSKQYRTIAAAPVYEGQLVSNDPLRGITFDWSVKPETDATPIGYAAFFELLNGFEKTLYMTREEVDAHGRKFSKAYQYDIRSKKQTSPWTTNFDAMARKTVIKLLISSFGPMSTELESAITNDQAIITDKGAKYIDNESDLDDEKATDEERNAIIEANQGDAVEVSDEDLNNVNAIFADTEVKPKTTVDNPKQKATK